MSKEYTPAFLAGARLKGRTPEEHRLFLAKRQEEEKQRKAEMSSAAIVLGLSEHDYFGTDPENW